MRRGGAAQPEGEAVRVVRDLHDPAWEQSGQTCGLLVCARVSVHVRHSLLGLGGDQQPQGAAYAEGLVDHGLHLGEGPEEQQVLVDGVDLPADLQAGHLAGQTNRRERKKIMFKMGVSVSVQPCFLKAPFLVWQG